MPYLSPVAAQRVEAAVVAALAVVVTVTAGYPWWSLLALFLVFDLSMLGYLHGPRFGAFCYNLAHSYTLPAALGVVAVAEAGFGDQNRWLGVLAIAWVFHIAIDRALGYGLKTAEGFEHTHLGPIGKARRARSTVDTAASGGPGTRDENDHLR
ncbi:protein of unknown function [Micromonospora phaseoli]|uniref:Uncharacterized protein n=1 Tax=Micromonospora phaseoli TaxID=1144548 RepID=A0A1H7C675_9ACTN|nr:DUF4260 domain-containing protein [Micromonospora phaseoli]PZV92638.1 uncharacterized protein DUF4260 [Micromonospora phaseoli]GIJ76708.1 hypothetical protein Xph01_11400 [Micromonospora phaseoli]SEJ84097.1 protein of unknown function [Micromonospora phaseoli]